MRPLPFVTVGGGISGLAVAHGLKARGRASLLLEASGRLGGNIRTSRRGEFVLEEGPTGFLDREPATRALARSAGVEDRIVAADASAQSRFLFVGGALRRVPSSPPAFLRSELLPFRAKLRLAGELFTRRARGGIDESLADFGRRHFGASATRVLLDAVQTGVYAGDLERLSASATFPRLAELERRHRSLLLGLLRERKGQTEAPGMSGVLSSFSGGMQLLPEALAAQLGSQVHAGVRVEHLSRSGTGFRLSLLDHGRQAELRAEQVILALPAFAAAGVVRGADPELAALLDGIPYAPVSVVHLGYAPGALRAPEGFGFLVPGEEKRRILGAIHASTVFPGSSGGILFKCMVGGARSPALAGLADEALVALAKEELAGIHGLHAEPTLAHVARWPRAIPQPQVGHLARVAQIEVRLGALPGLHLAGNAYRGVGVNDCIRGAAELVQALAR